MLNTKRCDRKPHLKCGSHNAKAWDCLCWVSSCICPCRLCARLPKPLACCSAVLPADMPGYWRAHMALTSPQPLLQSELHGLLQHDHLSGAALLVFANKQDLKDAMSVAELSEALGLHTIKTHSHHIQASCALTGDGLKEGLSWVAQKVHGSE